MNNINPAHIDFLKKDEVNRSTAIDAGRSFIVEAPAGAGKTELLTQRYLALLLTDIKDPEEIIALTFTNKAVAEMRKRIFDSLLIAASGIAPKEPHKFETYQLGSKVLKKAHELEWNLLENPGRLQITTLDALCGKLVRQMPYLSRFGTQPTIVTDATPLYQQASQETFALLEEEGDNGEVIGRVLSYFDNNSEKFIKLIESMLKNRDQWLRHTRAGLQIDDAEAALRSLIEAELHEACEVLTPEMQHALMIIGRIAASNALVLKASGKFNVKNEAIVELENWNIPLEACIEDLPRWRALVFLLVTGDNEVRKQPPNELGLTKKEAPEHNKTLNEILDVLRDHADAEDKLTRIKKLPSSTYSPEEKQLIVDLYAVLKLAMANLWMAFKTAKQVDFTQMSQSALSALGTDDEPTELQLQLDYKISHILVDEFQDTSPTQVELLKKLTAGWQRGDGRTLFLVGDPMQSIYRFRKADVGLFLKVKELGIGDIELTPLVLYRNNRSNAELVDWGNATFKDIFPAKDDLKKGAVKFAPAAPTKGSDPLAKIGIHPTFDLSDAPASEDDDFDPAGKLEAQKIISLIAQAKLEDPQGKIAVLVKARTHLDYLIEELRFYEPRIHYQAVEIESLFKRQAIQDLVSLTRALFHLADRVNWLAILRAPWSGLTLADLHALAADDHRTPIWVLLNNKAKVETLSLDGQKRVKHVCEVLAEAFENQGRQRPRRWVEGVWQCLGGPLCLNDAGELQDINTFFAVLDRLEYRGTLDLSRLEAELEKLFAAPDPAASTNVQVMTIHKAKGLEFDTVILPGLHRKSPHVEKELLVWDEVLGTEGQEHLVVAALSLAEEDAPSKSDFLHDFEKIRTANEMQRQLYVAATRAKRQLHLLGTVKVKTDKEGTSIKPPVIGTCLSLLWNTVSNKFDEAWADQQATPPNDTETTRVRIDEHKFQPKLIRLADAVCPLPKPVTFGNAELDLSEDAENDWAPDNNQAADVGTLVHRYLEFIATDGMDAWPETRIEKAKPRMIAWFTLHRHSLKQANELAEVVIQHLKTTLQSDDGRWLLTHREIAGAEVALTQHNDEVSLTHIIDRTFVEEGVRWIIDYKTTEIDSKNVPNGGQETIEGFKQQLERYEALFNATENQIKLGIYYTSAGRLVEL